MKAPIYIEPNAKVEDIKLAYNVPIELSKNGGLNLKFETGYMTESSPVAWQEINNKKVPVRISFKKLATCEASFEVGQYNRELPLIIDPVLAWNSFMGSADSDYGKGVAVDGSGNVYVAGYSSLTWGSPVNVHAGGQDVFIAKLSKSGVLLWNTFMGSSGSDQGFGVAVDISGNVYVAGFSYLTWGTPVNAHAGDSDAFVAKVNSSGTLLWNTFMGSSGADNGYGVAVDGSSNVYVAGSSPDWGTPVNAHSGGYDTFVGKLNSSGDYQWHSFMGSSGTDYGYGVTVDGSGNVYVAGYSYLTWGSPVNAHAGDSDVFIVKFNINGVLQWNTFMGSSIADNGWGIAIDGSGNVYVTGNSSATWGTPVNAHAGGLDAFVGKLNSSGALQWHTFMGSSESDNGYAVTVDGSGNVYVAGRSTAAWGSSPVNAHAGGSDAFVGKLNNSGALQWNSFMGSSNTDLGWGVAVDGSRNVYVTGNSQATWGSPVNTHAGGEDAFVVKLSNNGAMPWIPLLLLVD